MPVHTYDWKTARDSLSLLDSWRNVNGWMSTPILYEDYRALESNTLAHLFQLQKERSMPTNKPNCTWGFTAEPDWARICRELAAQGATVGRVTTKGSAPVTLVFGDSDAGRTRFRKGLWATHVKDIAGWLVLRGDHVDALLKPPPTPVKVEGFGVAPKVAGPTGAVSGAVGPLTAWVECPRAPGAREYRLGGTLNPVAKQHVPTAGTAYLGRDGLVYSTPGFGWPSRTPIGRFVPAPAAPDPEPRFGIFVKDGNRSVSFPQTFNGRAAAQAYLDTLPPGRLQGNGYYVGPVAR